MQARTINIFGFLACVALMGYALYSQHVLGLEPCPLCVFQRVGVIAAGIVFLIGALWNPVKGFGCRFIAFMLALTTGTTAAIAGRHVWLQNLPEDQVPACGAGLDFMLDTLPLKQVLSQVFTGSGECAEVSWRFLGLTMPSWVIIAAAALGLVGVAGNLVFARRNAG